MLPQKCFEMNIRWDAIKYILKHNFERCYSMCTDLVASRWFFRYSYLCQYCNDNNTFFGGGEGEVGHFWGGSFYPSNTLDRTLQGGVWPPFQTLPSVVKNTIPPSLVCKQNSSHLSSLGVNILFNCSDLGIHLCTTWQLFNLKTKLGGEICSSDINMQKGHCKWEYILWKSRSLQNTEATLCLSFSLILMNESNRVCIERRYAASSHLTQRSKFSPF